MPTIGVRELKNRAPEIVRTVREQQVEYVVTYRGIPVARLTPLTQPQETSISNESLSLAPNRSEIAEEIKQMLAKGEHLPPKNRQALALMAEWLAEPEEESADWWNEFNAGLEQHRFRLRRKAHPL